MGRDEEILRFLIETGRLERSRLRSATELRDQLQGAGFPTTILEILVRQGVLEDRDVRGARIPSRIDEGLDERAVQLALEREVLGAGDVEALRAFQRWAAGRAFPVGLAEVLVRRGYLEITDLVEESPARHPRTKTARSPAPRRSGRQRRPAGGRWTAVRIGAAAGAAFLPFALLASILVAGGSGAEAPPPAPEAAAATPGADPPADSSAGSERAPTPPPRIDFGAALQELEGRITEHLRHGRTDRALAEIDSLAEALPPSAPDPVRRRLDHLRGTVENQAKLARGEPLEGPERIASPVHRLDEIEEIWLGLESAVEARRWREVIELADRLIGIDPENPCWYFERAKARVRLLEHGEALRDLNRAVRDLQHAPLTDEHKFRIHDLRAQTATIELDFEAAQESLLAAGELLPDREDPRSGLGALQRLRGEPRAALETLSKLTGRGLSAEGRLVATIDRALCHLDLGDRATCLSDLLRAERAASPPDAQSYAACRAWAMIAPAHPDPDLACAREILDRDVPLGAQVRMYTVYAHAAVECLEGKFETAYRRFHLLGNGWTVFPEAGYLYARAARQTGRDAEADRLLERARRLRPALAERLGS